MRETETHDSKKYCYRIAQRWTDLSRDRDDNGTLDAPARLSLYMTLPQPIEDTCLRLHSAIRP